jgi:hypothetical protein
VAVGHRRQATRSALGGFRSTPDNREAEDEPPEPKGLARIEVRRARASGASNQSAARSAAALFPLANCTPIALKAATTVKQQPHGSRTPVLTWAFALERHIPRLTQ